ncbi:MAG TPA: hypothetical protein VH592_01145 [Gemmataceae bacterium]|jgi:hypothetical protein
MNDLMRPIILAMILVPLTVCIFSFRFACDSTDLRQLIGEVRRNEKLEQSRRSTFHRIDAREETVRQLIAERCSLSQALARFQELDDEWPNHFRELSRKHARNGSDAATNYQYILAIAKEILRNRPEEVDALLCRLEKQYQQIQAGHNVPDASAVALDNVRANFQSCRRRNGDH